MTRTAFLQTPLWLYMMIERLTVTSRLNKIWKKHFHNPGGEVLALASWATLNDTGYFTPMHLLYNDYWGDSPVYSTAYFKKFFKLQISLFDEIVVVKLVNHDDYFRQKKDAAGKIGFSSLQKICSAICLLTS